MKRLRKFLHLSSVERRLLAKAVFLLCAMRLSVCLLPFKTLRAFVSRARPSSIRGYKANRVSPDQIAWAVTLASRYLSGKTTCLPKALTAQVFLAHYGHSAKTRVGIARGKELNYALLPALEG